MTTAFAFMAVPVIEVSIARAIETATSVVMPTAAVATAVSTISIIGPVSCRSPRGGTT